MEDENTTQAAPAKRTRKQTNLVAMEYDGMCYKTVIGRQEGITTMPAMKAKVKELELIGRELIIFRDMDEVVELKEEKKLTF